MGINEYAEMVGKKIRFLLDHVRNEKASILRHFQGFLLEIC